MQLLEKRAYFCYKMGVPLCSGNIGIKYLFLIFKQLVFNKQALFLTLYKLHCSALYTIQCISFQASLFQEAATREVVASVWATSGSYLWTEPSPRHSVGLDWYDINLDNILPFCDTYFYCKAPTFLWKAEICHSSMVLVSVASACIAQLCPSSDFVWAHCVFRPID